MFDDGDEIVSKDISLDENVEMPSFKLWSPEEPKLYYFTLEIKKDGKIIDSVKSYFGMRKFSFGTDKFGVLRLFLNNEP